MRRHGIWRCQGCGCELLAKPSKTGRKHHDRLHTYAPKDHVRKWFYEPKNDRFVHRHGGKIGLLKAEFVEDFDDPKDVDLADSR